MLKSWVERGRVDSINVAVEECAESPLADTVFPKIHLGV